MLSKKLLNTYLLLLGAWLFGTILIDIFIVPAVFKTVPDRFIAGQVGMKAFSTFNGFEIFFAISTFFLSIKITKLKWIKLLHFIFVPLVIIYFTHMTPEINRFSIEMNNLLETDPHFSILEKGLYNYHQLYKYLDMAKIFLLLGLSIRFVVTKEEV